MSRSKHCWPWKRTQVEQRRESWQGGRLSDKPWSASYFSESVKFSQALWSLQLQTDSTAFLSTLNWPLKPGSLSYACSEFWLFLCWESPAGSPPTSLVVTSEMLPINKIRQKCCPPAFLPPNSAIIRSLATLPMALSPGYIRCCCLKISTHLNQPDTSSPKLRGQPSSRISSQRIAISLL